MKIPFLKQFFKNEGKNSFKKYSNVLLVFRKKLWWAFCQKGKTEVTKMSLKLRKMKINDLKAGPNFFLAVYNT